MQLRKKFEFGYIACVKERFAKCVVCDEDGESVGI